MFSLDHVAIAVPRIADCAALLEQRLGAIRDSGGPSPNFTWAQWRFRGGARLELIKPAGQAGFLHRFLAQHGPGIHHVTFLVDDLARAAERARTFGYDVVGYDDRNPGWKECFLHPKQAQGIVVQFAQAQAEPDGAPDNPAPAGGAALRTIRLQAQSQENADRQWRDLLGGAPVRDAGPGTLYRFPDSELQVRVLVEEGSAGPLGLELSADSHVFSVPLPGLPTRLFPS